MINYDLMTKTFDASLSLEYALYIYSSSIVCKIYIPKYGMCLLCSPSM